MHNHHANANAAWFSAINDTPGRVGPPVPPADPDLRRYFLNWLEKDGEPFWPFWDNVRSWWAIKHRPNVMLVHYQDLKRDLVGEMLRIAEFLDIDVNAACFPAMVEHCSFDWMKANAINTTAPGVDAEAADLLREILPKPAGSPANHSSTAFGSLSMSSSTQAVAVRTSAAFTSPLAVVAAALLIGVALWAAGLVVFFRIRAKRDAQARLQPAPPP